MGNDNCQDCVHSGQGDLERCIQCRKVAPVRIHVALYLAVFVLFILAVVATRDSLSLRSTDEGVLSRLIEERSTNTTKSRQSSRQLGESAALPPEPDVSMPKDSDQVGGTE